MCSLIKNTAIAIVLSVIAATAFSFCSVKPELGWEQVPDSTARITVMDLVMKYKGSPLKISEDCFIEGRVVSNGRNGNLPRRIIVEDQTGGISIKANMEDIFLSYPRGEVVRVNCNSLTLGSYGGLPELGQTSIDPSSETSYISEILVRSAVTIREGFGDTPWPTMLTIQTISNRYLNCYIAIEDVQFTDEERYRTWCDTDGDSNRLRYITTDRHIVDRISDTLTVRSDYSCSFAGKILPGGNGRIEGILTCFNGKYQLAVVDLRYLDMNGKRFD